MDLKIKIQKIFLNIESSINNSIMKMNHKWIKNWLPRLPWSKENHQYRPAYLGNLCRYLRKVLLCVELLTRYFSNTNNIWKKKKTWITKFWYLIQISCWTRNKILWVLEQSVDFTQNSTERSQVRKHVGKHLTNNSVHSSRYQIYLKHKNLIKKIKSKVKFLFMKNN